MTFSEFLSYGGYGFYVWWSFGMTLGLIMIEWIYTGRRHRAVISRIRRMARLTQPGDKKPA